MWCVNHVDLDKRNPIATSLPYGQFSLLAATVVGMPPFLPEINGHPIYSETERHESTLGKRRRRAVSQPTPMDIDSEEGCQSRCSLCNGSSPSTSWPILQPNIDAFNAKGVIARSSPNTSPIYFYHRGKPFFECAYTSPYVCKKLRITYVFAQIY